VVAEKDEGDKVVPEGCSPEHERWQRGGVITAEASHCAALEQKGELESGVEWCSGGRGGARLLWGPV
jgi:hypothetical protein